MRRLVHLLLLGALLAAGCGDDPEGRTRAGATDRIEIVAAFYPLFEAARRVGGDLVDVTNLTAAGVEPHDLELSTRQVDAIEDADLVLHLGRGFQPAVEEVAERKDEGRAVDLLEGVDLLEDGDDPHIWLDPVQMQRVVDRVAAALAEMEPERKAAFEANAAEYGRELDALHAEYEQGLRGCERQVLVTSHAAFGHLARRYGLRQEAIAGISPEVEPDPRRLAELVELVSSTGTTTVFSETLVSAGVAETLAREANVATDVLNPIEGLTEEQIARGETYVSIMRANLGALRKALACP